MEKKIDMVKLFAAIYRSLHIYKGVAESMDKELRRQGFVAIDSPNGVRFAEIKQPQYTNDAPLGEDSELNLIYPTELAESEDDRIMKEIIAFVEQSIHRCGGTPIPREQEDKWLAWLEKQSEHANFRNKIQVGDKVTRNDNGELVNLSQLQRVAKPCKDEQNQKHFELKAGHWYICHRAYCCRADHLTVKEGERFMCEKDGIVKGFEIKEPEKYFKEVCAPAPMESVQNSAWSEEDENRFKNLIELVKQSDEGQATKIGFIGFINRLRTLKDRYAWKPSEEQMQQLHNVFNGTSEGWEDSVIESLYNDLKKLKDKVMKANKAPDKIYVDSNAIGGNISTTVDTKRQDYPTCIEYTRTDAFVEKACEWLSDNLQTIVDVECPSKHHVESIPVLGDITQTEFLKKFKKEIMYLFD